MLRLTSASARREGPVNVDNDRLAHEDVEGLPLGHALSDLEDDFFRIGEPVSHQDVDRAAERHGLSAAEHAELLGRAVTAGYVIETVPHDLEAHGRGRRDAVTSDGLDSFTLLLLDVMRYPLLDAKGEVELARALSLIHI